VPQSHLAESSPWIGKYTFEQPADYCKPKVYESQKAMSLALVASPFSVMQRINP